MDSLLKETGLKSEAVSKPLEQDIVIEDKPVGFAPEVSNDDIQKERTRKDEVQDFDLKVALAFQRGQKWMEVPKHLLVTICQGVYPVCGYICWKNVKVCELGEAERLAKKDGESAFEKAFPKETDTKVRSTGY